MLSEPNISYKPFWGICRPLKSWRANSPNPIQIYCAPLNQEWTIIVSSNSSKKPDTVSTSAHVLVIILSLKKRHPRLRCFKTERDASLNIYISSILMSIPKHYINQIIIYLYSDNHEVWYLKFSIFQSLLYFLLKYI